MSVIAEGYSRREMGTCACFVGVAHALPKPRGVVEIGPQGAVESGKVYPP